MYEYKKIILLAALFSTGSPWVLKSTHTNVVPKLTDDVSLRCHSGNSEIARRKMDQLMRIRLLKRKDVGNWMTVAEISVPNNSSVNLSHPFSSNIVASGHLGTSGESFLSVTWPTAYDDIVGSYQCEVDGLGKDFRSDVHLSTQTLNITSFLPTTTDLVDIMIQMKHEIQSAVEDNFLEVRYWPQGNYTLLSPVSGCPDTPYTKMVGGWIKIKTETGHKPKNSLSSPSHLHADVFERCDSRNVLHLRFCRHPIPVDQLVVPWPKGSYCIHHWEHRSCLPGFKYGNIYAYLPSSSPLRLSGTNTRDGVRTRADHARFHFCCRSDGHSNVPILLPNKNPFYLYRYKGSCQKVKNMDVSDEWIRLESRSKDNYPSTIYPDSELNDLILRLCYYTPRT